MVGFVGVVVVFSGGVGVVFVGVLVVVWRTNSVSSSLGPAKIGESERPDLAPECAAGYGRGVRERRREHRCLREP